ncbi:SPOR domain-containing protein [Pusillimonas sp. ANT_WB101]|uniref:SPOR domain-containing protein n=1 Tax=Pusillimonas sp. ANT_WB101 TaxID=2597356 RepID=UPI0011F0661C|nr:SPOR domain-containing protein [Pusillimonas sp. ANT_WB101]KAA0891165.1 SPOR domain-containing protein [Pusillimonas sp. ANT_WB101]
MARTRSKSSRAKSGSNTLFGVMVGLILGLIAAVAVALFVTQVPMPFADKFSRDPAATLLPDVKDAPDPNIGLYGKNSPGGVAPTGPIDTAPAPLPGLGAPAPAQGSPAKPEDDLGNFIAGLVKPTAPAPTPAPAPRASTPSALVPGTEAPAKAPATAAGTQTTYFLQAGAFRSASDAEAVMARILMMGLPAQVQQATIDGGVINRVRVGPFKGIDEMNKSRARLGEEKIATSVVRP